MGSQLRAENQRYGGASGSRWLRDQKEMVSSCNNGDGANRGSNNEGNQSGMDLQVTSMRQIKSN